MKRNKIFKTLILIFVIMLGLFCVTGCGSNNNPSDNKDDPKIEEPSIDQDAIDYCIDTINEIGTVTLKNKANVVYAKEVYDALKVEEQALVTNYNVLQTAINTLNYLENEDKYILEGYQVLIDYLDKQIPSNIDKDTLELNFITKYEYKTDYNNYIFQLEWSTDDTKVIGLTGGVYHSTSDKEITVSCKISCLKLSDTATFSKKVTVEKIEKVNKDTPIVVCYYYGKYEGFNEVDYNTIDVVNYAFAQIASKTVGNNTEYYISVSNGTTISEMVNDLHKYGIKVCLSLGGWHDDSTFWQTYSNAAASDTARKQVAQSCLDVMKKYNLDGIDMDWEYPAVSEKANFSALMKEISITLKAESSEYLITGAFPAGEWAAQKFDFPTLNNYMDYFYVMTYDLDLDGTSVTKHMCDVYTTKACAQVLIKKGCAASKVVIGIAFYARLFKDVSATNNGYGQKCSGRSSVNYSKVKDALALVGTDVVKVYDKTYESYYLYNKTTKEWFSYDGEETITAKYNYAVSQGLGGVMYWSYRDDSTGDLMRYLQTARLAAANKQN